MIERWQHKNLIAGFAIFLVSCGALIVWRIQRTGCALSDARSSQQDAPTVLQVPPQNLIPPAPPPAERVVTTALPVEIPAAQQARTTTLTYDPAQSFTVNLERFRLFCDKDADPRTLEMRVKDFVIQLLEHAKANDSAIKDALLVKEGSPLYRNILLACLVRTDLDDKQGIAWSIALDQNENTSVRRTAAFVLQELPEALPQSQLFLRLLADPDDQVKVFALQSAGNHMNDAVYTAVQNLVSKSSDIHVRLAALGAIGQTLEASKNSYLTDLIEQQQTSAADKFSEASLIKRAAIDALDVSSPDVYASARSVALDTEEDPGVRRRAILNRNS